MEIKDANLLKRFRVAGPCEFCGRFCSRRDAAHVFTAGSGRLDVPFNLVSLGRAFQCGHHVHHHNGKEPRQDQLIVLVAKREGLTTVRLMEAIWELRRLPKDGDPGPIMERLYDAKGIASGSRLSGVGPDPQTRGEEGADDVLRQPVVGTRLDPWTGF